MDACDKLYMRSIYELVKQVSRWWIERKSATTDPVDADLSLTVTQGHVGFRPSVRTSGARPSKHREHSAELKMNNRE
jgi:hypothetical protein